MLIQITNFLLLLKIKVAPKQAKTYRTPLYYISKNRERESAVKGGSSAAFERGKN